MAIIYFVEETIRSNSNVTFFSDLMEYLLEAKLKVLSTLIIMIVIYFGYRVFGHADEMVYNLHTIFITITFIDFIVLRYNKNKEKPVRFLALRELNAIYSDLLNDVISFLGETEESSLDDGESKRLIVDFLSTASNFDKIDDSLCLKDGLVDFDNKVYCVNILYDNLPNYRKKIKDIIHMYDKYLTIGQCEKLIKLREILETTVLNIDMKNTYILLSKDRPRNLEIIIQEFSDSLVEVINICKGEK